VSTPNAPSVYENPPAVRWQWATCALNSCRERIPSTEYEAHQAERHYGHDELVEAAQAYLVLRDTVIELLNPGDDDVAEVAIIESAIREAARTLVEHVACTCTEFDVEDNAPCPRCCALGRLGDRLVER
jgi:hypothetical protein